MLKIQPEHEMTRCTYVQSRKCWVSPHPAVIMVSLQNWVITQHWPVQWEQSAEGSPSLSSLSLLTIQQDRRSLNATVGIRIFVIVVIHWDWMNIMNNLLTACNYRDFWDMKTVRFWVTREAAASKVMRMNINRSLPALYMSGGVSLTGRQSPHEIMMTTCTKLLSANKH